VLHWGEIDDSEHCEMLAWYKELIALRRKEPDLRDPRREILRLDFDEQGRWLRMRRGSLLLMINLSAGEQVYELGDFTYRLVLASSPGVALQVDAVRLPADGVAILKDVG
jgi:maltooligosyltrehalose trehalohydrolase